MCIVEEVKAAEGKMNVEMIRLPEGIEHEAQERMDRFQALVQELRATQSLDERDRVARIILSLVPKRAYAGFSEHWTGRMPRMPEDLAIYHVRCRSWTGMTHECAFKLILEKKAGNGARERFLGIDEFLHCTQREPLGGTNYAGPAFWPIDAHGNPLPW